MWIEPITPPDPPAGWRWYHSAFVDHPIVALASTTTKDAYVIAKSEDPGLDEVDGDVPRDIRDTARAEWCRLYQGRSR